MKELLISFTLALAVGSAINGYSQGAPDAGAGVVSGAEAGASDEGLSTGSLSTMDSNDQSFQSDVLDSDIPVIVDFWAEWCGPCKKMLPVVDQLASEYEGKVKVVRMDVDANPVVSDKYKVREIPTFLFFKGGKTVGKLVGITPKKDFVDTITKVSAAVD